MRLRRVTSIEGSEPMIVPTTPAEELDLVRHDTAEAMVAALQESDTAVEAIHDASVDDPAQARRNTRRIGIAAAALLLIGLLVARRRS
jgi:MYXO-CTERM domain-containing protein